MAFIKHLNNLQRRCSYLFLFNSNTSKQIFLIQLCLGVLLTCCSLGNSQNCHDAELDRHYVQMQQFIAQLKAVKALTYSDSIVPILNKKKLQHCEKTYWILLERAEALELNAMYENALNLGYDIVRKAEKNEWWKLLAYAYISLSRVNEMIGRDGECKIQLQEARNLINVHKLDTVYPSFSLRYASYHRIYGDQDSARIYAMQSIGMGQKYGVDRSMFDGYLLMGILSEDLDTSIHYFQKAVDIFAERGDFHGAASQSVNIASRLMNAGRNEEAWEVINQSERYLSRIEEKTTNYFRILSKIQHQRQSIFEAQGKLDSSYHYLKLAYENDNKAQWYVNQEKITQNAIEFAVEKEKANVK